MPFSPDVPDVAPAAYFPPALGRYEVAPGLSKFGRDWGGGEVDSHVFQIDRAFAHYRAVKLRSRSERLSKFYRTHDLRPVVVGAVARFITKRLASEHPRLFDLRPHSDGVELHCVLNHERLTFDSTMNLRHADADVEPLYLDPFDALASQVQEDFAVVASEQDRHWLAAVHLCFPNRWSAEEKVGRTFAAIHAPVAGMESMNRRQEEFVSLMRVATDGLVRFAWGVTFDEGLNQHPDLPRTPFDPSRPRAFLRVERQTIWGFPEVGASLFTIRTYVHGCAGFTTRQQRALADAVESMSPETLVYKGLAPHQDALVAWLRSNGQ